jgi:hypothetical protein
MTRIVYFFALLALSLASSVMRSQSVGPPPSSGINGFDVSRLPNQ